MKRFILIILILFSSVSCDNLANNNSNDLVARAGGNFLYTNDLPVFESKDDSLRKFSNFIESWAKEKVLYDLSLVNLSQSKKNQIDQLVDNYKIDLYINSYKDLIVNTRIDSISLYWVYRFYELHSVIVNEKGMKCDASAVPATVNV